MAATLTAATNSRVTVISARIALKSTNQCWRVLNTMRSFSPNMLWI